jgi:hypothetical protein
MTRVKSRLLGPAALAFFILVVPGCDADGVGDPCVPEDEYSSTFSGFALSEVSTESKSFQCQSRLCLVNHFQGRVSCPYGQTSAQAASDPACHLPGSSVPVEAAVRPQLLDRRAEQAVYCSCRCAGPDPKARYCECPSGFSCSPVIPNFALGQDQLPGSYCVRAGSEYRESSINPAQVCDSGQQTCAEP